MYNVIESTIVLLGQEIISFTTEVVHEVNYTNKKSEIQISKLFDLQDCVWYTLKFLPHSHSPVCNIELSRILIGTFPLSQTKYNGLYKVTNIIHYMVLKSLKVSSKNKNCNHYKIYKISSVYKIRAMRIPIQAIVFLSTSMLVFVEAVNFTLIEPRRSVELETKLPIRVCLLYNVFCNN